MPNKPPTPDDLALAAQAVLLAKQKTLVAGGFAAFKETVLPDNMPTDQIQAMELAFFAGVQHFLACVVAAGRASVPIKDRLAILKGVADELSAYTNAYYMNNVRNDPDFTQH